MFVVKGSLLIDEGVTLSAKIEIDDSCPVGDIYTIDNFTGVLNETTKDYEPKGFFIHVEEGGKATLKGTLSDFVTSRTKESAPRYVAPVVAIGDGSTFDIEGGTIKNNLVGYIADDAKANDDAQSVKQYVKGAGPNVPRVPNTADQKKYFDLADRPRRKDAGIDGGSAGSGITGTAGAVIYKNGAKGQVNNATISNTVETQVVLWFLELILFLRLVKIQMIQPFSQET